MGHAYSAVFGYRQAIDSGGRFLLRIEDIDPVRCKPEFEDGFYEDLGWLGLQWESPVRRQSAHMDVYAAELNKLDEQKLLYPCFCTRKDILKEVARSPSAPHGPEGVHYPGTCRVLSDSEREIRKKDGMPYALRLDVEKAAVVAGGPLHWTDIAQGQQLATPEIFGDVVLARKDIMASYHLCVTIDDHLQGVTLVTRGQDLFFASHLHRLLQALLDLDVPQWHHHDLLTDENGERLAKRNQSITLKHFRENEGKTPAQIMDMIGMRA
jgi:glutamyl-Q tRNA(Asp) synthetase